VALALENGLCKLDCVCRQIWLHAVVAAVLLLAMMHGGCARNADDDSVESRRLSAGLKDMASDSKVLATGGRGKLATGTSSSLVVTPDGTLWVWGHNHADLIKESIRIRIKVPRPADGVEGVVEVAASSTDATLLALADGSIAESGAILFVDPLGASRPLSPVSAMENVAAIAVSKAGGDFRMALRADGTVWTWGSNSRGQLGDGTTISRREPQMVQGLPRLVSIAAGITHSLALASDGTVWSWGSNFHGQLGDGSRMSRTSPAKIEGLDGVVQIDAGFSTSIALKDDRTVWAWGAVDGAGTADQCRTTPVKMAGLPPARCIRAGLHHFFVIADNGTLWAWGENRDGQLGLGVGRERSEPIRVPWFRNVSAVAAGAFHSIALLSDGTLWEWGELGHIPRFDFCYPYLWPHPVRLRP
jgi:alpha-tubulin suppressor-like RCC1 family protein